MFTILKYPLWYFKRAINLEFMAKLTHIFLSNAYSDKNKKGKVVFIGAGPGDPELLTIKAVNALKNADVVLVDWLVNPQVKALIPKKVKLIFVGKKCGNHSMPQHDINQLLLNKALLNKTVVRLKGGDPSIFARLAEETELLSHHQVPFQIIPGVTAASGCAAYTGIPLTHREHSQSVKFITAWLKDNNAQCDWEYLARDKGTLVFYMGLKRAETIASNLIEHGMKSETPIALIDQGTNTQQSILKSTLGTISINKDIESFKGPALIIVGDVINKQVLVDLSLVPCQIVA